MSSPLITTDSSWWCILDNFDHDNFYDRHFLRTTNCHFDSTQFAIYNDVSHDPQKVRMPPLWSSGGEELEASKPS